MTETILEIPPVDANSTQIIRSLTPPGVRHPTPSERMDFIKWYMDDTIQDQFINIPRYKVRKAVMQRYLDDFGIKISEQFLIGLDEGRLTKITVDGDTRYCLARQYINKDGEMTTFSLDHYCEHPFKVLKQSRS